MSTDTETFDCVIRGREIDRSDRTPEHLRELLSAHVGSRGEARVRPAILTAVREASQ